MKAKVIYLMRHGIIQSNLENIYAGRTDEELTEAGKQQAERTGSLMRAWNISVLYSSPLTRAVQTAELINKHIGVRLLIDPDLTEMDLGLWTGLSKNVVAMKYGAAYEKWCKRPAELRFDGVETVREVHDRVERVIGRFLNDSPQQVAAMVTHAALIKCAFLYLNRLDLNRYHQTHVPNASVFRLAFCKRNSSMARVL